MGREAEGKSGNANDKEKKQHHSASGIFFRSTRRIKHNTAAKSYSSLFSFVHTCMNGLGLEWIPSYRRCRLRPQFLNSISEVVDFVASFGFCLFCWSWIAGRVCGVGEEFLYY